jgi:hypothetical protein
VSEGLRVDIRVLTSLLVKATAPPPQGRGSFGEKKLVSPLLLQVSAPSERLEWPALLFTSDPIAEQEAYGADLPQTITTQITFLLRDPAIFEVLEGQRWIQVRTVEDSPCSAASDQCPVFRG